MSEVDAKILRLGAEQLDLVTLQQLVRAGLTKRQVERRVASGALRTVHRAVYTTTLRPLTEEQLALAACLVAGEQAFASHFTALRLHGVVDTAPRPDGVVDLEPGPVEITVPSTSRVRVPGIRAHRSELLGPRERMRRGPLVVSRPARAIIDAAGRLGPDGLVRVVDRTLRTRKLSPRALLVEARRPAFSNRPRISLVRAIASERCGEGPPESELEDEMLRLVRRFALPQPQRQYRVVLRGRDVRFDLAYPQLRLAIELNGWGPHHGLDEWQHDHDRRNAVEIGAWRMLEFTWDDITKRPWFVVSSIADALDIRPRRWTTPAGAE